MITTLIATSLETHLQRCDCYRKLRMKIIWYQAEKHGVIAIGSPIREQLDDERWNRDEYLKKMCVLQGVTIIKNYHQVEGREQAI